MPTYFVIQGANVEYNDETHYTEGYAAVDKHGFVSLDDAKVAAKERLYKELSYYSMYDFENPGEYGNLTPLMVEFLATKGVQVTEKKASWGDYMYTELEPDLYSVGATWQQFMDWCTMNGHDWVKEVPQLVHISEIEFPNQCKQLA